LAQATKKRASARRKKAPTSRKAAGKASTRVTSSRRASTTKRSTSSRKASSAASKKSAARNRAAATASLANTQALGHMGRLLREVGAIVCGFSAITALLALSSFDISDPGWSSTGAGENIQNSVGRVGAWFADVTFSLFGFMAYLIPIVLVISGWLLFRDYRRQPSAYRPFTFQCF